MNCPNCRQPCTDFEHNEVELDMLGILKNLCKTDMNFWEIGAICWNLFYDVNDDKFVDTNVGKAKFYCRICGDGIDEENYNS